MCPPKDRNPFQLVIEDTPGKMVVRLAGELDVWNSTNIDAMLEENPPSPSMKTWADLATLSDNLIVDMRELRFIDTSGLRWLLLLATVRLPAQPKILVYPSRHVERVIDILRINHLFAWPED